MQRATVLLLTMTAASAGFGLPSATVHAQVTAFTHVNVIPMDRERVLEDQTVIVQDGLVVAMGPTDLTPVPDGAARIDGRGKYLIPGLAEMHAHIPPPESARLGLTGAAGRQWVEDALLLYAANGITTIRGMLGDPSHLMLREQVEAGSPIGPHIWSSGPSVNGRSVETPDSASRTPAFQQQAGYDFIKIHPGLSLEAFDALDVAADEIGFTFSGHVPAAVGIERAIEAQYASVDHLDRYMEWLAGDPNADAQTSGFFGSSLIDRVDTSRIAEIVRRTREAGVWNTPTQTLMESWASPLSAEEMAQRHPEIQYVPQGMRQQWMDWKRQSSSGEPSQAQRNRFIEVRRALLRALQAEGAGILLGSDAPQVWNVPGFSAHRELASYVAAGLTPFQALQTGTVNVARFFDVESDAGTVAVGKQADFVLLDGNPLEDIENTMRQSGVMLRGVWMPRTEIEERLLEIAARYREGA